ncbi:MAG: FeoA domain-containing protein [Legionellales bacterium]|nr:FeoA domain-containing protein [Legionellales bacterium]
MMHTLDDWQPGDRFRLLDYGVIHQLFRTRLLAMGMTVGVEVQVIRIAPLGDPIQIDLRGVSLALRREDLLALHWKKL